MKKIITFLLLIISINVFAECDKIELARLKKLAEYVEITTSSEIKEKKKDGKVLYKYGEHTLSVVNLNDEIKARVYQDYYGNRYKEFKNNNGIGTLSPFYDGEKVTVTIEAYVKNDCSKEKLRTITIKLPYYNVYSEDNYCSEDSQFAKTNCCSSIVKEEFSEYSKFQKCLDDYYKKEIYPNISENYDDEIVSANSNSIWIMIIVAFVTLVGVVLIMRALIKKKKASDI